MFHVTCVFIPSYHIHHLILIVRSIQFHFSHARNSIEFLHTVFLRFSHITRRCRCLWIYQPHHSHLKVRLRSSWLWHSLAFFVICSTNPLPYFALTFLRFLSCGLVVRLPGWGPRCPEFNSRRYQTFWVAVDLERGPLNHCEIKWGATWMKVTAPV
jgi:hypothetical protein